MESFVASLTLAGDLLMHHRQPETKEKRSILVGKPAGNDIPTLECVVASLTLARELLMHHRQPETKDKRFILVGKPSGNDIPTLE